MTCHWNAPYYYHIVPYYYVPYYHYYIVPLCPCHFAIFCIYNKGKKLHFINHFHKTWKPIFCSVSYYLTADSKKRDNSPKHKLTWVQLNNYHRVGRSLQWQLLSLLAHRVASLTPGGSRIKWGEVAKVTRQVLNDFNSNPTNLKIFKIMQSRCLFEYFQLSIYILL